MDTTASLRAEAVRQGFTMVGIAPAVQPGGLHHFLDWLDREHAGEMGYLPGRKAAYHHPRHVLDGVRSLVLVAMNYHVRKQVVPAETAPASESQSDQDLPPIRARVARYAQGTVDYHDLLRARMAPLVALLNEAHPASRNRAVVDTAPLLERDFARLAGMGWFGKNTMLISRRVGSWFVLGAVLTDMELRYDPPHETAHCGTCTRCLDACPTGAFVEPWVLDARRCISYLTIELRGPIPAELREGLGDWLFGCDVCQEVCPWNRKAPQATEPAFRAAGENDSLDPLELLELSAEQFRARFATTPYMRPRRAGLLRNAAIVLGNSCDPRALIPLARALDDEEPIVRGAAAWALGRFTEDSAARALHDRLRVEDDLLVASEIRSALACLESRECAQCPS